MNLARITCGLEQEQRVSYRFAEIASEQIGNG
jgi:hypothetical protein